MEHRASPRNDATRKRVVKAMLIAEGISDIAIIDLKVMFALHNWSNNAIWLCKSVDFLSQRVRQKFDNLCMRLQSLYWNMPLFSRRKTIYVVSGGFFAHHVRRRVIFWVVAHGAANYGILSAAEHESNHHILLIQARIARGQNGNWQYWYWKHSHIGNIWPVWLPGDAESVMERIVVRSCRMGPMLVSCCVLR